MAKKTKSVKGMARAALADLSMLLALALAFVLLHSPAHTKAAEDIPDPTEPPHEKEPGDRPAAGHEIARVHATSSGEVTILYRSQRYSLNQFRASITLTDFPDHFVLHIGGLGELPTIAAWALNQDAAVSIEVGNSP